MDQVLQLALQIGGNRLTTEAVNKAMEILGLNQEENNPLIFGMPESMNIPFLPKKFNVGSMLAKTGINAALKGGFSSAAVPIGAAFGLYSLAKRYDPLNPNSQNYNPYLGDELNYLSSNNLIGTNIGPGQGFTRYRPESVLQGKNVVSAFGTNSYVDMLQKYKTNMENNKKISAAGKARNLKKVNEEIAAYNLAEVNRELKKEEDARNKKLTNLMTTYQGGGDGSGGFDKASHDAGKESAAAQEQSNRDAARGRFGQGGLASLL